MMGEKMGRCPKCGKYFRGYICSCGYDVTRDVSRNMTLHRVKENKAKQPVQAPEKPQNPYELGLEYYRQGTESGYRKAKEQFLLASQSGNVNAMCFLGEICERGLGCNRNLSEAFVWYTMAENAGRKDVHQRRLEIERMIAPAQKKPAEKKRGKKLIPILLIAVVLVVLVSSGIGRKQDRDSGAKASGSSTYTSFAYTATSQPTLEVLQRLDLDIGDYVYLGTYGGESIRWKTLDVSGNSAMLIAANCIDCRPFNNVDTDVTWETCSLRTWLNGKFYDTAFSNNEKSRILQTYVTNPNPPADYDAYGGNATYDYVFVLSYDECRSFFSDDSSRRTKGTEYALSRGANGDEDGVSWWLRTPGYSQSDFMGISKKGYLWSDGYDVNSFEMGVRPVIWIDMG